MTMRTLINKTTLPALLVAGLVGVAATAPASATVWGASDAGPSVTAFSGSGKTDSQVLSVRQVQSGIPGSATGASDADPTAGNRNLTVNVIDGNSAPRSQQVSLNKVFNPEVDTRY